MDPDNAGYTREDPVYVFTEDIGGKEIGIIAATFSIDHDFHVSCWHNGIFALPLCNGHRQPSSIVPEKVHKEYQTPYWAIIVTGLSMAAAITFLPVKDVAKLASGFKIMIFIVINACVIVLRTASRSHTWYAPGWKSPFYPFFQLLGIIGGFVLYS